MEEEKTLFLDLLGTYKYKEKSGKYEFELIDDTIFTSKTVNYIADPAYDSIFKYLFGREDGKSRLIDFISSIMFPNEEEKIEDLTYLTNELAEFIRADIACRIKTDKRTFLMCIEIQIGNNGSFSKRLLNYDNSLRNYNTFKDCYFIGLYLSVENNYRDTNYVNLIKKKNLKQSKLKYLNIIVIDINDEVNNMMADEPVIINGKEIVNKGKEFIKLLGLRNWAKSDSSKYALPNISLLSSNLIFIECLELLGSVGQDSISLMKVDEQSMFDEKKEKEDQIYITHAFDLFIEKKNAVKFLKDNKIDLGDYDSDYISSILLTFSEAKEVNSFIKLLKNNELILNSDSSSSSND